MADIEGLGDIIAGIGDIKPDTIKLLHDRERMGLEGQQLQAQQAYQQSQLGLASARLQNELRRLNQPIASTPGMELLDPNTYEVKHRTPTSEKAPPRPTITSWGQIPVPDPSEPSGYRMVTPSGLDKPESRIPPNQDPAKLQAAQDIASGPWTFEVKKQRIAGLGLDPSHFLVAPQVEGKSQTLEQLTDTMLHDPDPLKRIRAKETLQEMQKYKNDASAVLAAALEKIRGGDEKFGTWDNTTKDMAFLDKYYTGRDPSFAWGDRTSRNQFQHGYYAWMNSTGRSPVGAITDRSDINSYKLALNDITKREALINTFVDRIEANAKVVRDIQKRYNMNKNGRLMNEAQNLFTRGAMGSGDLESLRLALFSLSQEVTKVETGQLGISAPNVTQSEELRRIHDINLNAADLDKVITTSTLLGQTSKQAMAQTRNEIRMRLGNVGQPQSTTPQGPPVVLTPDVRTRITSSPKWKSLPDGEPIIIDGRKVGVKRGNTIMEQ